MLHIQCIGVLLPDVMRLYKTQNAELETRGCRTTKKIVLEPCEPGRRLDAGIVSNLL
jgi:hypothetical protein